MYRVTRVSNRGVLLCKAPLFPSLAMIALSRVLAALPEDIAGGAFSHAAGAFLSGAVFFVGVSMVVLGLPAAGGWGFVEIRPFRDGRDGLVLCAWALIDYLAPWVERSAIHCEKAEIMLPITCKDDDPLVIFRFPGALDGGEDLLLVSRRDRSIREEDILSALGIRATPNGGA